MIKETLSQSEYQLYLQKFFMAKSRKWGHNALRNNTYYFEKLTKFLDDKLFNRDNVEEFFASLKDEGLSTSTRRQAETAVLAFVHWIFFEGIINKDWSQRIERTRIIKTPRILPSQGEMIELIRNYLKPGKRDHYLHRFSKNEHMFCLLFIVCASGTRNFETREIKLSDVSIEMREIKILKGKTGPRVISIPNIPWLIEELERRVGGRNETELRAISDRKHYKEDYTDRLFVVNEKRLEAIMRGIGIRWNGTPLNVHDLRRICLRDLKRNGAGIDDIKNVAGHRNIETTQQYLSYDTTDQKNTLKNYSSEVKRFRNKEERINDLIKYLSTEYGSIQYSKTKGEILSLKLRLF